MEVVVDVQLMAVLVVRRPVDDVLHMVVESVAPLPAALAVRSVWDCVKLTEADGDALWRTVPIVL
ncbi:hypothetical protein DD238_003067 [Peronospora effusa]|uniref:Uncharacterized protein n=1 Tax=Peronospora effusa TaxID=542832 RepID=A0A3M6VK55_9STRA|nr:hypothetical protein DD238_003067 [Peronospora effusa]RQM13342.1 hypothetical protein DD237_003830 [Peronospora effusa]